MWCVWQEEVIHKGHSRVALDAVDAFRVVVVSLEVDGADAADARAEEDGYIFG